MSAVSRVERLMPTLKQLSDLDRAAFYASLVGHIAEDVTDAAWDAAVIRAAANVEATRHHAPGCRRHEQGGVCYCAECRVDRDEFARSVRATVAPHIDPDSGERWPA